MSKRKKTHVRLCSPSGSHTILVYRSYTDTKHLAVSLRQQSLLWYPMFARIPQWLLKSLQKLCIIITHAPWCVIIRPPGCLAHWGTRVGYRTLRQLGVRIPPWVGASWRRVGFPIVKYRRSAPIVVYCLMESFIKQELDERWTFRDLYRYALAFHMLWWGWPFAYSDAVYEIHGVDPLLRGCPCPSVRLGLSVTHVLCSNDWTD